MFASRTLREIRSHDSGARRGGETVIVGRFSRKWVEFARGWSSGLTLGTALRRFGP